MDEENNGSDWWRRNRPWPGPWYPPVVYPTSPVYYRSVAAAQMPPQTPSAQADVPTQIAVAVVSGIAVALVTALVLGRR